MQIKGEDRSSQLSQLHHICTYACFTTRDCLMSSCSMWQLMKSFKSDMQEILNSHKMTFVAKCVA